MWSPPIAIDINGVVDFYLVEVFEVFTGRRFTLHAVELHIIAGPLNAGYAYRCRVSAFTVGQGPFTNYFIVYSQELGRYIALVSLCLHFNGMHCQKSWL
jgi:hypothetical protein